MYKIYTGQEFCLWKCSLWTSISMWIWQSFPYDSSVWRWNALCPCRQKLLLLLLLLMVFLLMKSIRLVREPLLFTFAVLTCHPLLHIYHNSSFTRFGISSTILKILSQNSMCSGKKPFLIFSFLPMSTYWMLSGSMTGHKMLSSSGVSCGVGSL